MKKFLALLALMLIFLTPTFALAQDLPQIPPADEVTVVINNTGSLEGFFVSLAALVPLVTAIAAFLNSRIKNLTGTGKQIIAWLISVAIAFGAWYLQLGIFNGLSWYLVLIYGLAVGLAANGFFDIKFIQAVLSTLRLSKK